MKRMSPWNNSRNHQIWQQSQQQQESLLIGFMIAGDPSPTESLQIIDQAFVAGLDIIELGIPSQHPKLDGEIIQRGHARVLETQPDMEWIVDYCSRLRKQVDQPIWVMGYREDLYQTGLYQILAKQGLLDALLIPDCSLTEQKELDKALAPYEVDVARFVDHSLSDDEMREICQNAFLIYAQSYPGKTGRMNVDPHDLSKLYQRISEQTTTAFQMVGFGIGSPEKVKIAVEIGFQGVVVGSALVAQIEQRAYHSLYRLISEMKKETKNRKEKGE